EVRVDPFVVHVGDAIRGLIVLHADPGLLAAHPLGAAAREGLVRARVAENAAVELRVNAILMGAGSSADLVAGDAIRRQLDELGTKARIDVPIEHLRGRVAVCVSVPRLQAVFHERTSPTGCCAPRGGPFFSSNDCDKASSSASGLSRSMVSPSG